MISFSATATDTEDGTLPASAYTWNIDFLHEGHVHPGAPISGVTGGSFTIPTSGHDFSGNTRYRITLTVTDSDGLQSSQFAIVFPDKVNLTFDTAPGGLTLYVDGIAHTGPFVYDTLIGFSHTIEARDQTASERARIRSTRGLMAGRSSIRYWCQVPRSRLLRRLALYWIRRRPRHLRICKRQIPRQPLLPSRGPQVPTIQGSLATTSIAMEHWLPRLLRHPIPIRDSLRQPAIPTRSRHTMQRTIYLNRHLH